MALCEKLSYETMSHLWEESELDEELLVRLPLVVVHDCHTHLHQLCHWYQQHRHQHQLIILTSFSFWYGSKVRVSLMAM